MLTIFSISLAWCLNIYCDFFWSPTFNFLNGRALLYIDSDMMQIDTVLFIYLFFFFESEIDTVSVLKEEQVQNVKMMIITFKFLSFKLYINGSKNFCSGGED